MGTGGWDSPRRTLRGLSLAWEARVAEGAERAALLAELDEITRWLAARAAEEPDNFLHLLRLVEAERAWTDGDFRAAALAFDAARGEVAGSQRPWHRALITERAARFHLAFGLEQAGYELLARARREYLAWGATLKARQLDWAYPALRPDEISPDGGQSGIAAEQAAASRARIMAAADQARRRIERDLHDGAQQRLVSLALQLRQARAAVPPGLAELGAELDRAVTAANSALDELGAIARGIHPAILTSGGLRPAVRALAHQSAVPVRLAECTDRRLPEQVEVTAYYVIAEALTNAAKHARAATVIIRAEVAGGVLVVTIHDDGIGGASPDRGTGLTGLRDRIEALGGRLRVESPPGAGTMLRADLPVAAGGEAAGNVRYSQ
ncbi:MAG: ATP-binding protein [Trebonia sp.]|jgi:signal transduction histidine kinase